MNTNKKTQQFRSSGNDLLAAGAATGAIGTVGALITGAVCPLCVITTPVLLGAGLVKRLKLKKNQKAALEVTP